jgi:Spy/CpxP family protein refolding chaperone
MKRIVLVTLAATALGGSALVLGAAAAPGDQPPPTATTTMGQAGGFMLDAHLAGMKAALKLTPDQEKNWAAFEGAVRDAAQARREVIKEMRQARSGDARPTPIERMNATADRLAKASTEIKAIAEAAKPLYESLDGGQQRHFGPLMATLIERHRPMMDHGGMGRRGDWRSDQRPGATTPD